MSSDPWIRHGLQVVELGRTEVPAELRQEFLLDLSDRYTPEKYSLLHNNCNNFRRAKSELSPCLAVRTLTAPIFQLQLYGVQAFGMCSAFQQACMLFSAVGCGG